MTGGDQCENDTEHHIDDQRDPDVQRQVELIEYFTALLLPNSLVIFFTSNIQKIPFLIINLSHNYFIINIFYCKEKAQIHFFYSAIVLFYIEMIYEKSRAEHI